jgi:hypothetical protein
MGSQSIVRDPTSIQFTAPQVTPTTHLPSWATYSSTRMSQRKFYIQWTLIRISQLEPTVLLFGSSPWVPEISRRFPGISPRNTSNCGHIFVFGILCEAQVLLTMRLPMATLQPYHGQLYQSWLVTKFFITHLHLNEDILLFASECDGSYSLQNNHYCHAIGNICRFIKQKHLVRRNSRRLL